MIDWYRVGTLQADGYDTDVSLKLARERYGWEKTYLTFDEADSSWLESQVLLVQPTEPQSQSNVPADPNHENVRLAEQMLREGRPAMYRQCQRMLQSVYTYISDITTVSPYSHGCSCGPIGDRVSMEISVTINGAPGILEGVVHELAHNKMKFHGISLYHWERLMLNEEASAEDTVAGAGLNVFVSPIRKDKLRPMGACISAHYSYLHVAELFHRLFDSGALPVEKHLVEWLQLHTKRVIEGRDLIVSDVVMDEPGKEYFRGLQDWANSIIERTERLAASVS